MNLLIEQRPTSITSSKSQQQQSHISNENDMNNSSSSSPLVVKIKRNSTKQQSHDHHSNSSPMSEENNHSHSTTNSPRLKRTSIPNSIVNRRPSSPAFNGKQQQQQQSPSTKRSVTIDSNNNDLTSNIDEISSTTKRFKRDDFNHSSNKVDACVETVSIGLATEPDQLGPCEPGTSVVLEGIVWNETDSGVLVVNVTWRGKTYVGTLLDSTKQDWACPRLTCESPTSDYDPRSSSKTSRTKRTGGAGGNARSSNNQQTISLCQQVTSNNHLSALEDRKLRNNIKSRQSKRLNNLPPTTNDDTPTNSPPFRNNNQTFFPSDSTSTSSPSSEPQLLTCSEPHCHKRFTSNLALTYHLSNAHKKTESTPTSTSISQANTRDEEDVAHILANVADYVRRSSPPSSLRGSPEHQRPSVTNSPPINIKPLENSTTLTWPCPQISSKPVLSSPINQILPSDSTRCKLNHNETNNSDQDDSKNSIKPADHFVLHIQDESLERKSSSSPNYLDSKNSKKTPPPISSSPAYSDISDEDPTPNEQTSFPPSTINLLSATTNGKLDENGNNLQSSIPFLSTNGGLTNSDLTNPAWTAQMLFQQFGSFIQPQTLATDISSTPNRLNSNNTCPTSDSTSDSSVKNILDARRTSTSKSSSSPPTHVYPFVSNESKFPTPIINTLTSPNENLLHLTPTTIKPIDIVDYSLANNRTSNGGSYHHHHHSSSSTLHPSR